MKVFEINLAENFQLEHQFNLKAVQHV